MLFFRGGRKKRRGVLLEHPLDDPLSCKSCDAACCRSFIDVNLTWEEFQRLEALGAARLQLSLYGPHKLIIEDGCEFLEGSRCSIYQDRPRVCRLFVCEPAD